MKRVLNLIILISICVIACENQEEEWNDYDINAVYFPWQSPIRTLSFGEDRIDNSLDKELKFDIGLCIGGMYENKKDWEVDYIVDNSLTDHVFGNNDMPLLPLPSNYYTLSPLNTVIIPKGVFNGLIKVQLTEAFLDDSLAITGQYVIPLIITGSSADSILTGIPAVSNPDRRITSHWEASGPSRDWVLYGIKFINAYEGSYLQRGRIIKYLGTTPIDTIVYRSIHVEKDRVVSMHTISKNKTATTFIGQNSSGSGEYSMELEFDNMWGIPGGPITISPREGSLYEVSGTGQYFDKATSKESWIEIIWPSMHLNYSYNDGENTYNITDTLVFRDRGIKFETHTVRVGE